MTDNKLEIGTISSTRLGTCCRLRNKRSPCRPSTPPLASHVSVDCVYDADRVVCSASGWRSALALVIDANMVQLQMQEFDTGKGCCHSGPFCNRCPPIIAPIIATAVPQSSPNHRNEDLQAQKTEDCSQSQSTKRCRGIHNIRYCRRRKGHIHRGPFCNRCPPIPT